MLLKLALLGWSLASAQGASLDAHRHFTDFFMGLKIARAKDEANITRDMSETVERAFLISDAYLRQGEDRHAENAEVSAFAASRRDRFLGICGSNLDWEDGPAELERCLALPAMRGVK
ncbi:MAG: hypothetical protein HY925_08235, partial [Elusimicrobia bacterium]|nr:hypothetical protein [Elusimicrobiota bacterium]